jgi:hypothetical protein
VFAGAIGFLRTCYVASTILLAACGNKLWIIFLMTYGGLLGAALKSLLEVGGQKLSSLLAAAPLLKAAIAFLT